MAKKETKGKPEDNKPIETDDIESGAEAAEETQTAKGPEAAEPPKVKNEPEEKEPEWKKFEAERDEMKDKFLRLAAEYDNYRKRSQKERESLYSDIKAETVSEILPVYDNIERALKQKTADEAYYRGIEMTMLQLEDIFKRMGVSEIKAMGEKFDPEIHNGVMKEKNENVGEGIITEVYQKGFKLGDKVIRTAMVKVAN